MNYEEMSDFEINSAVHNITKKLGFSLEFLGCDAIKWSKKGGQSIFTERVEYSKNGLIDYCNNPSDAWPIVMGNKIAVMPWNNQEWQAFIMRDGEPAFRVRDKNPLRAAMIVFLMIQEAKRG